MTLSAAPNFLYLKPTCVCCHRDYTISFNLMIQPKYIRTYTHMCVCGVCLCVCGVCMCMCVCVCVCVYVCVHTYVCMLLTKVVSDGIVTVLSLFRAICIATSLLGNSLINESDIILLTT